MAKSPIREVHSLTITGIYFVSDSGELSVSIEDIGDKSLKDLLTKFEDEEVTITVKKNTDVE